MKASSQAELAGSNGPPLEEPPQIISKRFRCLVSPLRLHVDFSGLALDGEVEDYRPRIVALDWGDAPEEGSQLRYPTTADNEGAHHVITGEGPILGEWIDAELDGQPTADADRDDGVPAGAPSDEDGVEIDELRAGLDATIKVTVGQSDGFLNGWIDWNADGDWDAPGEQIFDGRELDVGVHELVIPVPPEAQLGPTYARFRITGEKPDPPLVPGGFAPTGEVEDYLVTVGRAEATVELPEDGEYEVDVEEEASKEQVVVRERDSGSVLFTAPASQLTSLTLKRSEKPDTIHVLCGVAPESDLISLATLSREPDQLLRGMREFSLDISNHSYGVGAAADGVYDADLHRRADEWIHGKSWAVDGGVVPRRPMVFAAGNTGTKPRWGSQFGYFSLGNKMKNAVVVGNWNTFADADDKLGGSSSLGPAYDGRIKPDVVAPGNVWSTRWVGETVTITIERGTPGDGGFTLIFDGASIGLETGREETESIDYDASKEDIKSALEALDAIGAGDARVKGKPLPDGEVHVEFTGSFARRDLPNDLLQIGEDTLDDGTGQTDVTKNGHGDGYKESRGGATSWAAPVVSGIHALMLEAWQDVYSTPAGTTIDEHPPLPSTLRAILIQTAEDIGDDPAERDVRDGEHEEVDSDSMIDTDTDNGNDGEGRVYATPGPDYATG